MPLNNEFKIKNDLNTLGRILSSGVDIATSFPTTTLLRTLTGTLLPTSIYQNASGNWQSTYLTVSALSASWSQGGTNLAAVTNYLSTNNVLISGLRITDNLTVVGSISTLNNGTSQQWNQAYNISTAYQTASSSFATNTLLQNTSALLTPLSIYQNASGNWQNTYTTVLNNSGNWQNAYNTGTAYQSTSSSFATNTLLQTTSGLLTPLTTTRTLTGLLVLNTDFSTYRTSVANSTATLLPITTYQNASGNWQGTFTTVQSNSANWNTAYNTSTAFQQTSGGFALSGYNTTIADSVSSVLVGGASPQAASIWKTRSIIQVLDTILFPDVLPTYTIPTISIAMSPTTTQYEVGELINVTFTGTFTRNDAGGLSAIRIQRSPLNTSSFTTLSTTTNPVSAPATNVPNQFGYTNPNNPTLNSNSLYTQAYVDTGYTVPDGITYYRVTGDYRSGLAKPNNKGVPDTRPFAVRSTSNPQLNALSFESNNTTITGRRKLFYSNDTGTSAPTNSTQVRALTGVIGSGSTWPFDGTSFNISINPGTKRIVIAYPTSLNPISEIKNGLGFNVTADFTQSTVSVNGANSTLPTNYYVYTYIATGTFGSPETYSVIV